MNLSKQGNPVRRYAVGSLITALALLSPVIALLMLIATEVLIDFLLGAGASTVWAAAAGALGLVLFRKFWPRTPDPEAAEDSYAW
jgi:hypothetical protein